MPKKASFAVKDAAKGGFGMQEGNGELVGAVTRVHQYPVNSKTGKQGPPFLCVELEIAHLDKDWNPIENDEPEKVQYGVGRDKRKVKENGDCECKFHVGEARDAEDQNVKDLGHDLGTEGNCLAVLDENSMIHERSKWGLFFKSLEECGFKPEVLANGFMPDLVGLKGHFKTHKGDKFTTDEGTEGEVKCLVLDKISVYPYERKKAAPAKSRTTAAATTITVTAKPGANGRAEDIETRSAAITALKNTIGNPKHSLSRKESVDRASFQKAVMNQMMLDKIKTAVQKPILDLIRDDDSLVELAAEVGFLVDVETNTLNFNV